MRSRTLLTLETGNAIHSFGKMLSVLEPARADDASAYESWIREHAPIDENETRFLTRQADLMSLHRRHKRQERPHEVIFSGDQVLQTALLALLLFLVLPLIAFPQIPSVGGRLFILTIIGAAEVAMVSSTRFSHLMSGKEWRICGIAYVVLSPPSKQPMRSEEKNERAATRAANDCVQVLCSYGSDRRRRLRPVDR